MTEIIYKDWRFILAEENPVFGKLKITAVKEEWEEEFFVYGESLTLEICEMLYDEYLYAYNQ